MTTFFSVFGMYVAEVTDVFQLQKKITGPKFSEEDGETFLSWTNLNYPCVYKVETYSKTTGLVKNSPPYHLLNAEEISESKYKVPHAGIPTYYKISARGIFQEIFSSKNFIANPNYPTPPHPVSIYHYPKENPASLMPFLVWHKVPDAVCYEVEILSAPPEIEGGTSLSKYFHLDSTRKIFTNGYQADLRQYKNYDYVYWRARALTLHQEPIGEFSRAEKIYLDKDKIMPDCPIINNFDFMAYIPLPIYPVYDWIPLNGAKKYEVELLNHPPKVENDIEPSPDSLWRQTTLDMSSCYDEYARPYAGPYYWRVRALDENDKPIGRWSNSEKFVVADYSKGVEYAVLGDSISHGGGAMSYSPRALEYSWESYLDFPAVNLSRSGDISSTTLARFEKDVLPFKPKNLIILTGTNSMRAENISAETVISDLEKIGTLCRENNIKPIFLTLMPINPKNIRYAFRTPTDPLWHEKLKQVNDFIKSQDYYVDLEPYFYDRQGNMDENFSIDGIHPDLRGKMLMAEIVNKDKALKKF
ncbi:MAG: GDSL family lipase [Selenomonadaceae bacterium]|nr:GDSL family lipase [Selenomonadaceae bacterium]